MMGERTVLQEPLFYSFSLENEPPRDCRRPQLLRGRVLEQDDEQVCTGGGIELICRVLPIAPSTYHERVAQRRDPSRLSARAQRNQR